MKFLVLFLFISLSWAKMPEWSYDPGPDADTQMGKELIDLTAEIPNYPAISDQLMGRSQKFRPAFGPIPWRMLLQKNKVKILFVGQDGTHIAEAAGRPATAGFGGRSQDLAKYFGVHEGAAFINAYAFTIKGQYGAYETPYFYKKSNGEVDVRFSNFVNNQFWLMSNSLKGPIAQWRNRMIDWIIRNNRDSLKMIVLFGGAARDALATFVRSKGGFVGSYHLKNMDKIQMAETEERYAGGNNTFPVLLSRNADNKYRGDLYSELFEKKLDYTKTTVQREVKKDLEEFVTSYMENAVFTKGGPYQNGILNAAQLGGYDLDLMEIDEEQTRSLKGITLDDGSVLENDIVLLDLPHPTYLSRLVMDSDSYVKGKERASQVVMSKVAALDPYVEKGWEIEADGGLVNQFARGLPYEYGRTDIGPEFYDFGTPENRMVSKSTARRMSGEAHVVIIGTRENGNFSRSKIEEMTKAKPAPGIDRNNLYLTRPSTPETRYLFDAGPGEDYAKLMVTLLDQKSVYEAKEGMSFESDGIDAFNIKTHPSVGDFGHYRGTFTSPRVVIMADPIGYDDMITARALTGERGQYLHGLMEDFGINDQYLVFKTVPFGMDGASDKEWKTVLAQTKNYRDGVMEAFLAQETPEIVLADGKYAAIEAKRIFSAYGIPVIEVNRQEDDLSAGILEAGKALADYEGFDQFEATGQMANIPRTHLSFYSRVWEGTSGDRVITSEGKKYKGLAFAEVVPEWAFKQKYDLDGSQDKSVSKRVEDLLDVLRDFKLPLPNETMPRYLKRTNIDPNFSSVIVLEWEKLAA